MILEHEQTSLNIETVNKILKRKKIFSFFPFTGSLQRQDSLEKVLVEVHREHTCVSSPSTPSPASSAFPVLQGLDLPLDITVLHHEERKWGLDAI